MTTPPTTLIGRGGGGELGEVGLCFKPNDDPCHGSLFFLFFSADRSSLPHRTLLLVCPPRLIRRPTNEHALSSSSATLTCTTALLPPSRGRPRMDVTRKEALWINNRFNPHWVRGRLQFQQQKPSAFSTPRGSGRARRLVRVEQLWQEFFSDPSQWWDNRLTKKTPKHPDFKHKRTLDGLWVDGSLNPSWVKEKMASMTLGHIQSGDGLRSWVPDSFCNGDKLSKLCEEGRLKEALHMLELMVQQTTKPPIHAYVCLLNGCSRRKALAEGKQVHALIVQSVLDSNIFLANNLVRMYSKCGSVLHAHKVFSNMPQHDVYSWTAIISAYADSGEVEEAMNLFHQMQETGLGPDKVLFVPLLKACARLAALEQGRQLHSDIIKRGFQSDVIVGSTLVNMYAKCGCTEDARELFDNMSERNVVSWNAMIAGYAQNGLGKEALALYEQMKQEGVQPDNVTFVLLLKACASLAALENGRQLHSDIIKRGFQSDVVVGSTLVDMYAKCGCTQDARELFDNMSERDVVSWNAMIAGYAQNGLGKEALALYEQMKQEGVQPDNVTFALLLNACANLAALEQGKELHSEIIKRGFLSDVVVGSNLVDMYAKCGCTEDARELFDNVSEPDVVSGTAMIAGYAQNGLGKKALWIDNRFNPHWVRGRLKFQQRKPSAFSTPRGSGHPGRLVRVEQLWQEFFSDPSQWWDNRLTKKTPKHPDFKHKRTLDGLWGDGSLNPSWVKEKMASMTLGHIQSGDGLRSRVPDSFCNGDKLSKLCEEGRLKEALHMLELMVQQTTKPAIEAYVCVLKGCSRRKALAEGKQVHALIVQSILDSNIFLANNLVRMYSKCGSVLHAHKVFSNMPQHDVYSWTAIISAYADSGEVEEAMNLFHQMQETGLAPDKVLFVPLLKACARLAALEQGRQLHSDIIKRGFQSDVIVGSTLVNMYAKCGCTEDARELFDNMSERNVVSWNAMIAGYAQNGPGKEALALYEQMKQERVQPDNVTFALLLNACANLAALEQGKQLHSEIIKRGVQSDVVVGSTLVDMYAKCGCTEDARELFDSMSEPDVVSWTAMIAGYAQNGLGKEALALYEQMKQEGVQPDNVTFVLLLKACASLAALEQGKQLHSEIIKRGFQSDVVVGNTLVDMYAKCGCTEDAQELFDNMSERNVVSWNAMIAGYAHNGIAQEALALFEQMQRDGTKPNEVTYISVLSACAHSGLVDQGCYVFDSMCKTHGVTPTKEHYACMVDLLGRAGCLADAEIFINKMPIQPNSVVWMTLLGAARNHGHAEIGRRAFDRVVKLEPKNAAPYVLLSNIYAGAGRKDELAKIRNEMKEAGAKKMPGCSWIEVDNQLHAFVVGDATHPQSKENWIDWWG
ncbi:hypothetical protein O6H91_16G079700 [Diphasiastrum complanatum]|uniref:Uncharacterized protein n=1 Tax=Diphasiastrum complanatum TaxID=34168 RepID=A0ACC2BDZ4_DIPCM|nr:hypothetical protein O6H91_16G079700 [Diphasiastrum complanatum]